jgi:uncharacterized protein involved in outer membrane biogenesis
MKRVKIGLIALAVVLVLAATLPFLVNLDGYIPEIEQAASSALKQPVTLKHLGLFLLPSPHVTVDGVTVGGADDLSVGKVKLTPALFSLLSSTKVIKRVEIDDLVLTQKGLDKLQAGAPSGGSSAQPVRVESLRLDNAQLKLAKIGFGPFDAKIDLDENGTPVEASVQTRDHKLEADIRPDGSNFLIAVKAKGWTLPAGPPIVFDELEVKGSATLKSADLSSIAAKLYDGSVTGTASLDWKKGVQMQGHLTVSHLELKKLTPLLSPTTHFSGKLTAAPVISASAADAAQLASAVKVETPFNIESGVIQGVDIEKAATHLISKGAGGGETRFDQLSGHLVADHGNLRFTQLKISSGALAVDGDVNMSAKKELSGRINAQVKVLGAPTSVPLNVAGTADLPLLYPTGASIGGAAVGTALLGPGVGTAVGAKAGNFVEGLFGSKDAKKADK